MHHVVHYGQIQAFLRDPATVPLIPYMVLFAIAVAILLAVSVREAKASNRA